jgi:hypothetical protein
MITGVLYKIFPEEVHRDFHSRKFWIQEMNVKYPNMWQLEMWHDDVSELLGYKVGDVVECDYRPHGRLYDAYNNEQKVRTILQCTEIKMVYESK